MKKHTYLSLATLISAAFLMTCLQAADKDSSVSYRTPPFPNDLKRYQTQIFNLFDKNAVDRTTQEHYYDAEFVERFQTALKPYLKLDPILERKLFSGPGPQGTYIEIDGKRYLFYAICQAHACNTTNLALLYQIDAKKITGRLQYKCDIYPLNSPSRKEISAINALAPINIKDSFYQESCKYEKRGTK